MAEAEAVVEVEETAAGGGEKKAEGRRRLPLPVLLGIVVAVQAVLSFLVLSFRVAPAMKPSDHAAAAANEGHEAGALEEAGEIISLEPMVMNLATLEGEKPSFAKLGIAIELGIAKAPEGFESRMPLIRDAIITTVSSRTLGDVTSPDGKERLRSELQAALRQVMGVSLIRNVYFTNFVIQ